MTIRLDTPGLYRPRVIVSDAAGNLTTAEANIVAGNKRPELEIKLADLSGPAAWGTALPFEVLVEDPSPGVTLSESETQHLKDSLQVLATKHPECAPQEDLKDHPILTGLAENDPGAQAMVEYGCTACHRYGVKLRISCIKQRADHPSCDG